MKNDDKEWRDLCQQVSQETDHHKLMELAEQINRLLEVREQKLRQRVSNNNPFEGNGQASK